MLSNPDKFILTCIRHGQTQANLEGRFIGVLDQPLTAEGIKQATETANFLKNQRFLIDEILTSPLQRCIQTAQIIADRFEIEIDIEPAFKERNYGVFESLSVSEANRQYPEIYARYEKDKPFVQLPNGETAYDVESRIKAFLENKLVKYAKTPNLLVVTHLNPIRALLRLLGLADWSIYFRKFQNASITQIETDLKTSRVLMLDCGIDMNC